VTAPIILPINVRNPGAYLAACGVVEVVGAFDAASSSTWERRLVGSGRTTLPGTACIVRTSVIETELAAALREALSCRDRWEAFRLDGRRLPLVEVGKDDPLTAVRVWIRVGGREEQFPIDHWYHRLARADDPKLKKRLQEGKSDWKFWGGQVRLHALLLGLIDSLAGAHEQSVTTITELLSSQRMVGSSLNLDAAARRGALDRGFGANEAKEETEDAAATRPALELLGAIGLSAFFPPRRIGGKDATGRPGTAGYHGESLAYCAWGVEAPLPLARLLARGTEIPGCSRLQRLVARRTEAGSKYYHRFEYARGAGSLPTVPTDHEETEEEEDGGADAGTG
jgi:CRISPR-associated protein Csb3